MICQCLADGCPTYGFGPFYLCPQHWGVVLEGLNEMAHAMAVLADRLPDRWERRFMDMIALQGWLASLAEGGRDSMRASGPSYTVMVERGGLLMVKDAAYRTLGEARTRAQQIVREGWALACYVFYSTRGEHREPGWTLVATYTEGNPIDVTTRYQQAQAIPLTLPPPSPADDLGEESF